jgi:predicted acyl esterase
LRRLSALLAAVAAAATAAFAFAGAAGAFTKTDGMLTMDDGVLLGTTLYIPDGAPPAAGWPAILILHGLGLDRRDMNTMAEHWYVPRGYAVLTYDARGHGQSGGVVTLDGPREIADVKIAFSYLASQPAIDRAHIGGWGISYGGGATFLAAEQGVPYAAIETFETWTDLGSALLPNNLSKSGLIAGLLNQIRPDAVSQLIASAKTDLLQSTNLPALRTLTAERSSLPAVHSLSVPTAMFQGKRDFAFDMSQMTRAFTALKAPKRLYLGNLGHAPSKFLADDFDHFMAESVAWYDRFLEGVQNGIDRRPPVELAPTPFKGKGVSYQGLPPTKTLTFSFPGKAAIGEAGKVVRTTKLPRTRLEQFGRPLVKVTASTPNQYPHLVAVLTALTPKGEVLLSEGGIQTTYSTEPRVVKFRLDSDSAPIPAGSRLRLTLASASTTQDPENVLYLQTPLPPGSSLTIGDVTVDLPVLKTPISG